MTRYGREQVRWVVQPLLDAGVPAGEVADLVFALAFQAVVGGAADLEHLVAGRPASVRTAWRQTLGRMVLADSAAETSGG